MEHIDKEHPSFGTVQIARTSCHPSRSLFDSQTRHSNVIALKVLHASRYHNEDTHGSGILSENSIVEVYMSEAQYAHMVSSANLGSGTPCTISQLGKKIVEECPVDTTASEYAKESVKDCNKVLERMEEAQEFIDTLVDKKSPLNKKEKKQLSDVFGNIRQQIKANIPFLVRSLQKTMDGVVEKAKMDIEVYCMNAMNESGIKRIEKDDPVTLIGNNRQ